MTKTRSKSTTATLVASIAILLVSALMLLHLSLAFVWVNYEKSCAVERYRISSLSPDGPEKTFDEILEEIKLEFSKDSWACRLVSGNIDKETSFIIVFSIILAFSASIIGFLVVFNQVELQKEEKEAEIAKVNAEAEIKKVDKARKAEIIKILSNSIE